MDPQLYYETAVIPRWTCNLCGEDFNLQQIWNIGHGEERCDECGVWYCFNCTSKENSIEWSIVKYEEYDDIFFSCQNCMNRLNA
jgi:hypothetical protein